MLKAIQKPLSLFKNYHIVRSSSCHHNHAIPKKIKNFKIWNRYTCVGEVREVSYGKPKTSVMNSISNFIYSFYNLHTYLPKLKKQQVINNRLFYVKLKTNIYTCFLDT